MSDKYLLVPVSCCSDWCSVPEFAAVRNWEALIKESAELGPKLKELKLNAGVRWWAADVVWLDTEETEEGTRYVEWSDQSDIRLEGPSVVFHQDEEIHIKAMFKHSDECVFGNFYREPTEYTPHKFITEDQIVTGKSYE